MRHAFLITAYKDLPNVARIARLLGADAAVFIHLDRKTRASRAELDELRAIPTVKLLSRRYRVNWGSTAHLKAILHLAEAALRQSDAGYLHLISGSDQPLLSPQAFQAFMEQRRGQEFLEHFPLPTKYWRNGGLDRITHWHPLDVFDIRRPRRRWLIDRLLGVQERLGIHRSTAGLPPLHGGSTWWSLSRPCVAHLLDRMRSEPQLRRRFAHTRCGEEILVQTLVMDSPFAERVVNDNLRHIDWRARNGSAPAVLDITDLPVLEGCGKLFARKVERPVSDALIAALVERKG